MDLFFFFISMIVVDYGFWEGFMIFFFSMLDMWFCIFFCIWNGRCLGVCLIGVLILVFILCLILVVWFIFLFVFENRVVYFKRRVFVFMILFLFIWFVLLMNSFCKWVGNFLFIFKFLFFFDIKERILLIVCNFLIIVFG